MKPFDFNIHPNLDFAGLAKSNPVIAVVPELSCSASQLIAAFKYQLGISSWSDYISGFNCMIFTSFFHNHPEKAANFIGQMNQLCISHGLSIEYTFLANPTFADSFERIIFYWAEAGVRLIKFHSYHQKISEGMIPVCVRMAKIAEEFGIGVCVDASYGSLGIYRYDNLKLATEILLEVKSTPVVILHAGGLRSYEAALIASSCENAFIELSFSPHYYFNTSVYQSFVDIFQLLPPSRFLYASDYPYIDLRESLLCAERLFLDGGLSATEIEEVFAENARKIFAFNQ
jgi:hypothetical protein